VVTGFDCGTSETIRKTPMIFLPMEGSEVLLLPLSPSEAQDLFSRCLRSMEPDTASSENVLQKLAVLLERGSSQFRKAA
jgi:hypothetical protein